LNGVTCQISTAIIDNSATGTLMKYFDEIGQPVNSSAGPHRIKRTVRVVQPAGRLKPSKVEQVRHDTGLKLNMLVGDPKRTHRWQNDRDDQKKIEMRQTSIRMFFALARCENINPRRLPRW